MLDKFEREKLRWKLITKTIVTNPSQEIYEGKSCSSYIKYYDDKSDNFLPDGGVFDGSQCKYIKFKPQR